ncbi:MAG: hypothetical protein P8X90_16290 [Desulfobacterales bacterium]
MSKNPIIGFQVDPADIQYIGRDLQRPECILADEKGLRIVAEGFKFTNEIRLDAAEQYLYIVETCGILSI